MIEVNYFRSMFSKFKDLVNKNHEFESLPITSPEIPSTSSGQHKKNYGSFVEILKNKLSTYQYPQVRYHFSFIKLS